MKQKFFAPTHSSLETNKSTHPLFRRECLLSIGVFALIGSPNTRAAELYWDLNGNATNVAVAVTGTWNTTNNFWNTIAAGTTGGTITNTTSAADDLVFSSGSVYTAGTITISSAQLASSISFEDNIGVTLSGVTSITIGGTGATGYDGIRVLTGNNAVNSISTALILAAGPNTIQNAGTGVLTISGGITGAQNLILQNNSTNAAGITISGSSLNNTGTVTNSGLGAGNTVISAVIGTNVTGVTQNSATSVLTLSGTNTFTGQVSILQGILSIATINGASANGVLGNNANSVSVGNTGGLTGTLSYTGSSANSNKKFTMATGGTGAFDVTSEATTLNLSGVIDGSGNLTKTGAGTLTMSVANTYTGTTTINAGTLSLSGGQSQILRISPSIPEPH